MELYFTYHFFSFKDLLCYFKMDNVNDLPISEDKNTPHEIDILQKYFKSHGASPGSSYEFGVKETIYATLLFIVMANPVIDYLLDYIPNTGSPLIKIGIKSFIYFILFNLIFVKI